MPICRACDQRRLEQERTGISTADEMRVVTRLLQDLVNTLGPGYESVVEESAARIRLFTQDAVEFEQRVVDDVQQHLHDTFADTTWPACPDHQTHPLWYSDGQWRCEQTGRVIASLGRLCDEGNTPAG